MDEADKTPPDRIKWQTEIIAEDEISELLKKTAKIETSEDFHAVFSQMAQGNFFDDIRKLIKTCDDILREHGWPETWQRIWVHPLQDWEPVKPGEMRDRPWSNHIAALWVQEQTADLSDVWYAARIGFKSRLYLEHIDKGHADRHDIHYKAFEIASLRTDWQWRSNQKPSIVTGKKQRGHLAELRSQQNRSAKADVELRRELIKALLSNTRRKGGSLTKWLQNTLSEKHSIDISERTIRSDLKTLKK